jgi:predicted ATPase
MLVGPSLSQLPHVNVDIEIDLADAGLRRHVRAAGMPVAVAGAGVGHPGKLRLTKDGLEPVTLQETDHYRVMREFCADPAGFVEAMMEE